MGGRRGTSMVTIILLGTVLLTMLLTVASTATFHLQVATHESNKETARNLAESAVAQAIEKLVARQDFGNTGTTAERTIKVTFPSSPGAVGRLTFDSTQASQWGIPISYNNVENDTTLSGQDRVLPPYSAQLMAVGEANGITTTLEVVVSIPRYKFALATSGTLSSSGGLLVASVDDTTDLSGGLSSVAVEELLPGNVASNSTGVVDLASTATNPSLVTGDVSSVGSVTLGANTTVQGAVLQNAEPTVLPDLDITNYDPAGWVGLSQLSNSVFSSNLALSGPVRRGGNLTISNGGLDLDNAYLYVDGDLTVNGGISGKGAVFCTGEVTVSGGSTLSAENIQAVAAAGDITLGGYGEASSLFKGVLYSKSNMALSDITVVGAAVGNGPANSTFTVDRVSAVPNPQAVSLSWNFPFTAEVALLGPNPEQCCVTVPDDLDLSAFYDPGSDAFRPDLGSDADIPLLFRIMIQPRYQHLYPGQTHVETTDPDEAITLLATMLLADQLDTGYLEVFNHQILVQFRQQFRQDISNLNDLYQSTRDQSLIQGEFSLDPNQFIQFPDKIRVVWVNESQD